MKSKRLDVDNIEALYQYSIPNTKLYYPEPYVASPSFIHNDIWYMHILVYWYWLWFIFIFIIVFFFITFLSCVRWCNPRLQPKRETRGVSRSKCGDLITATIPVTWAISIIISESADAIDYYDGFSTTELIVGIRAYQWGWEYYYPKDIDLKYSLKPNYNHFIGNSLKYEKKSELKNKSNKMFNMMKKTNLNSVNNYSIDLLSPSLSKNKYFNSTYMSKNSFSIDSSFKNITKYKKINFFNEFQNSSFSSEKVLNFVNSSYKNDLNNFKIIKSYNLLATKSFLKGSDIFLDLKTLNKLNKKNNYINFNNISEGGNFKKINFLLFNIINKKKSFFDINLFFKNKYKLSNKVDFNFFNSNLDSTSFKLPFKNVPNNLKFSYSSKLNTFSKEEVLGDTNFFKKKKINFSNSQTASPFYSYTFLDGTSKDTSFDSYSHKIYSNKPFQSIKTNLNHTLKNYKNKFYINEQDTFNSSNLWKKNFLKQNLFLSNSNLYFNFNFKNLTSNFSYFLYQDYDFLNKEALKILDEQSYNNNINVNNLDNEIDFNQNYFYKSNKYFFLKNNSFKKTDILSFFSNGLSKNYLSKIKSNNLFFLENKFFIDTTYVNKSSIIWENKINESVYSSYMLFKNNYNLFDSFFKNLNYMFSIKFNFLSSVFFFNNYKVSKNTLNFEKVDFFNKFNSFSDVSSKFLNKINLRQSASEMLSDYKSLQKVSKLRFDDNRSHLDTKWLSNSHNFQFDLNSPQIKIDKILNKNSNKTLQPLTFVISELNNNFFKLYFFNKINNYSFDFPFLVSLQSDQSRYIWFDWFSRWSKYEVQQASLAKLGIYGLPKFDKLIEYGSENANYLESENYLSRLMVSRKNYFVSNRFQPLLESNMKFLLKNKFKFEFQVNKSSNLILFLDKIKNNFYKDFSYSNKNILFNNSESGLNKRGKNFFKSNYLSNDISKFSDIATKKEFALRQLMFSNNVAPLISNLDSSNYLSNLNKSLVELNFDNSYDVFSNKFSFKNQYAPIKRGISNMIRIQASNMVALPVEVRIQVLASSRDIIHSWAIPSAGIKIDCIPGYSSHRVMFFMLSGIYWGQCMEICGRYHHWMPIIIYFMKRDIFFLWCTHFVLSNKTSYINNYANSNNYFKKNSVSFQKSYN